MSTQQLVDQLLTLPLPDRVDLAQALWQSIDEVPASPPSDEAQSAIAEAHRRDGELESGAVAGRSHQQVMEAARRALGCA